MPNQNRFYRVVIVDDHKIFTNGFANLLKKLQYINYIEAYNTPIHFLTDLPNSKPDVVFMDIEMPEMKGFEATQKALKINSKLKVIGVSFYNDGYIAKRMIDAGACGFITKHISSEILHEVFEHIEQEETYISPEVILNQAFQIRGLDLDFSEREISIMKLLSDGKGNHEIATRLCISEKTVETEKSKLYKKLDVNSAIELVALAYKLKILK